MEYTNQAKIENFLHRSLISDEIALLPNIIQVISNDLISAYTNRNWNGLSDNGYEEAPEAEERLYDGNGSKEIYTDDFIELSRVKITDDWGNTIIDLTDTTTWVTYPLNTIIKSSIRLKQYKFYTNSMIGITAVFSSGNVPDSVVYVATTLAAQFLGMQSTIGSGFKRENIEGYSYEILTGVDSNANSQALLSQLDVWKKIIL